MDAKYKYALMGIANYEDHTKEIPQCLYVNEKELCEELTTELVNNTEVTSYMITIVRNRGHKKATKRPQ